MKWPPSLVTSQNGWPASKDPHEIGVKQYAIADSGVKLRCAEKVAPLLVAFASQFHEHIEAIDDGNDDWGYCYREIRGSQTVLSNHSSATAIDLNATKHPLGAAGTFTPLQVTLIQALCKKYGIRWGGDYKGRKDEMHFEISLDEAKAAALIEKLGLSTKKEKTNAQIN